MKILSLLVLFMVSMSIGAAIETPSSVYFALYAVNDYSKHDGRASNLTQSVLESQAFYTSALNYIHAYDPNITVRRNYNRLDKNATVSNFVNDNTNNSTFVFFSGHGNYGGIALYDGFFYLRNKSFGGKTKWVLLSSCLSLNLSKEDAKKMFGGVHAILGFNSLTMEGSKLKNGERMPTSNYLKEFSERFFYGNYLIWYAFYFSVKHMFFDEFQFGIEPAVWYVEDYISDPTTNYGQSRVRGFAETFRRNFDGPMSANGLNKKTLNFGTPRYK